MSGLGRSVAALVDLSGNSAAWGWGGGVAEVVAGRLLGASVQGALAVALVWAVCRLFPRLPAGLRCGLWWLACAKLLVALVGTAAVPLPVLPAGAEKIGWGGNGLATASLLGADATAENAQAALGGGVAHEPSRSRLLLSSHLESDPTPAPDRRLGHLPPRALLPVSVVTLWLAGLLAHLAAGAVHLRRVRGVVRRARPAPAEVAALAGRLGEELGLRRPVAVLVSAEIDTPQVVGLRRPAVLLPAAALPRLDPGELRLTLCHELLHVRRGDLRLGWVPALALRLFFFHPLAHVAAREYALAREAACDAAVLAAVRPAPETYGRLLLRLGVAPRPPRWAAAGAAPTFRTLKRRLDMLQHSAQTVRPSRAWWGLAALAAVLALVPFRMVAHEEESYAYGDDDTGDGFVLLHGDDTTTMSGSGRDHERARRVLGASSRGIWFERGGKEYVIRDEATVAEAAALFAPQRELGRLQGELGARQGELGARQGEIGREQEALARQQAELAQRQAEISARQAELIARQSALVAERARTRSEDTAGEREKSEELHRELTRLHEELARLGRAMGELGGGAMAELGRRQAELGRLQGELGAQQGELGRRQAEAARQAQRGLRELLDRALASGAAKEVK